MMTGSFTEQDEAAPGRLAAGTRIYAVGDVHGCDSRLAALHGWIADDLARWPIEHPQLVHLGDYIDRGPDSAGVVARLAAGPPVPGVPTVNLRGNHEQMMLDSLANPKATAQWLANSGADTLAGWDIPASADPRTWTGRIPLKVLSFLAGLPLMHVVDGYVFVHAGLRPGVALARQTPDDLMWIRKGFLDWPGQLVPDTPALVAVHGHTPTSAPDVRSNRIGIDTGAVKGGALTCVVLEGARLRYLKA